VLTDKDYFDNESAIARIGGNTVVFSKLLRMFLAEDHIGKLKEAADGDNHEAIVQLTHALKGVSANLSLNKLRGDSTEVESSAKVGRDYKEGLDLLYDTYDKTVKLIYEYLNKQ
jgi:HPt (histidine-containing phosphotransfer) domain-containing protein